MKRKEANQDGSFIPFDQLILEKKKNDADLSPSERQSLLAEKLYQIYTSQPSENTDDESERRLVRDLIREQASSETRIKDLNEAYRREFRSALVTYLPLMIPVGIGAASLYLLFGYRLAETPLPTNFFLQSKLWETLLESKKIDPLMQLVKSQFDAGNKSILPLVVVMLMITAAAGILGIMYWDERKSGIVSVRKAGKNRKSAMEVDEKKILDIIHLLGLNEVLQVEDDRIIDAVRSTALRVIARDEVMKIREETMQRRRKHLTESGIQSDTQIADRVDDFPTTVEEEVEIKLKSRGR